ncbi:MAG: trigger factor [Bacilli bacterium]|nr:trigger factor [Erysipelotrichaceae bacterium]MDD6249915.1 trigger factor [Bacillales bacterium]MDD7381810.1 trigger factor [Bacillales bacterium]MDY2745900.1 trigger factor [Bacilli bacterium]MDY3890508.1 trigger factor [Bacilli bacterium]
MEKKIEKNELDIVVTVTVNGDEWKKAQNKEFNKRASKVVIKGFRPGKAPAHLIKASINQGDVINDAIFTVVNKAYQEALDENKFYVFTQPKLNVTKVNADELEATVSFCLPPEITLGEYKKLGIAKEEAVVTDDDVNAYLENLRKEHAVMQVKEDAAALGDSVVIDFKGYINDEAFEGGEAKGYELELGSNMFIPGFEDQLVGIKAGEARTVNVKFPENYVEELKGKDARFEVTCSDVKVKILPELNDEFAEELELTEVTTLDQLKEYGKKQLLSQKEQQVANKQIEDIVNKAVDNASVKLPTAIVEEEAAAMLAQMKKQIEDAGLKYEDYIAINKLDEATLQAQRLDEARKNLKSMLVVEKIIALEKLEVTPEMVDAKYAELASQYGMKVEDVKKALEPNKAQFEKQIRNSLFTEFMLANN